MSSNTCKSLENISEDNKLNEGAKNGSEVVDGKSRGSTVVPKSDAFVSVDGFISFDDSDDDPCSPMRKRIMQGAAVPSFSSWGSSPRSSPPSHTLQSPQTLGFEADTPLLQKAQPAAGSEVLRSVVPRGGNQTSDKHDFAFFTENLPRIFMDLVDTGALRHSFLSQSGNKAFEMDQLGGHTMLTYRVGKAILPLFRNPKYESLSKESLDLLLDETLRYVFDSARLDRMISSPEACRDKKVQILHRIVEKLTDLIVENRAGRGAAASEVMATFVETGLDDLINFIALVFQRKMSEFVTRRSATPPTLPSSAAALQGLPLMHPAHMSLDDDGSLGSTSDEAARGNKRRKIDQDRFFQEHDATAAPPIEQGYSVVPFLKKRKRDSMRQLKQERRNAHKAATAAQRAGLIEKIEEYDIYADIDRQLRARREEQKQQQPQTAPRGIQHEPVTAARFHLPVKNKKDEWIPNTLEECDVMLRLRMYKNGQESSRLSGWRNKIRKVIEARAERNLPQLYDREKAVQRAQAMSASHQANQAASADKPPFKAPV